MTDPCARLKKDTYEYTDYRCDFWEWLSKNNKGFSIFKSPYKEVWEGTNTNAEYLFDLAAKAAGRAVLSREKGFSFKLQNAIDILQATSFLYELAEKGAEGLPDPEDFDKQHRAWCEKVHKEAKERLGRDLSYGRSAKLINVFLKALMTCKHKSFPDEKEEEKAKWYAVHPPIDRGVLEGMRDAGIGNKVWDWLKDETASSQPFGTWTKYKYEHYRQVICMIRCNLLECGETSPLPLWKNERFFKP